MDTLYHQTNKLIQQTQQSFQALEQNSGNVLEIEADIQEKITTINSNCEKLDVYLYKVPIDQRPNAKMRCDQLKYDARHLQAALVASRQKRARREAAINEREQLLNRRFAPNPDLTTINIDYALQHQNSLQNSHRGVDEMLHTGVNALESLRSQRLTLKGAHRRIMDMANTLGLSNHTMRLIEKRAGEDKYILILGIVITLLVIVFVIVYFT
ncbi:probable Golgi SNAP receptor complex member 2 [Tribolium castaneum]|uniref:Putative Golgi SNAP receptor complex member 2-like Protein n=1 Tax=Tribolium castaneum TaxID=7070 RepID=D6WM18_TRICA|nr:PREDICTED: probable Golgi SNAP receptor complex member 2 [Tribolium castaneum]EFA03370.1 putative Golgi SNAP receptor complex member 2-like Protein [Tribolium castaneum]|eukprot:XP_974927.1 PREDICTED: probable Golgi SNAP receptor complex member 2 [Tribolium castaneum]